MCDVQFIALLLKIFTCFFDDPLLDIWSPCQNWKVAMFRHPIFATNRLKIFQDRNPVLNLAARPHEAYVIREVNAA